jgi:hypothetical protein
MRPAPHDFRREVIVVTVQWVGRRRFRCNSSPPRDFFACSLRLMGRGDFACAVRGNKFGCRSGNPL